MKDLVADVLPAAQVHRRAIPHPVPAQLRDRPGRPASSWSRRGRRARADFEDRQTYWGEPRSPDKRPQAHAREGLDRFGRARVSFAIADGELIPAIKAGDQAKAHGLPQRQAARACTTSTARRSTPWSPRRTSSRRPSSPTPARSINRRQDQARPARPSRSSRWCTVVGWGDRAQPVAPDQGHGRRARWRGGRWTSPCASTTHRRGRPRPDGGRAQTR